MDLQQSGRISNPEVPTLFVDPKKRKRSMCKQASKQSEKKEEEKRKNVNQKSEHILVGGNRAAPYQKGEELEM